MRILNLGVVATALLVVSSARATNIAGDYVGGGTTQNFADATGYFFTPSVTIDVVDLGYYSNTGAALSGDHNVGIFATDGTELASALIPAGSGTYVAGTVGGTWMVGISDLFLTGGTEYYIMADNNTADTYAYGTGAVTYDPSITWNGFGSTSGPGIASSVATNFGGVSGNLGPNFEFNSTAIPEPGTAALMVSAAALLFGGRRWLRRVSNPRADVAGL